MPSTDPLRCRRLRPALLVACALALPASAPAQARAGASARIEIDNDLFAVRHGSTRDHDYTHGTRLVIEPAGVPAWLARLAGRDLGCVSDAAREVGCAATSVEIGQEIYTPRVDAIAPVPGERPYAGWLYAGARVHLVSGARVRTLSMTLGVTGPPSLAERAQHGMHALLGERQRLGWAHQLRQEPGLVLGYDEGLGVRRTLGIGTGALNVDWGAKLGNVRTSTHAGVLVRLGIRDSAGRSPADLASHAPTRFHVLAGFRQDLVLRDLFVEGNTFRESAGATRIPLVSETTLGIGVRHDQCLFEYVWVRRGREYDAQRRPHEYGSFRITLFDL